MKNEYLDIWKLHNRRGFQTFISRKSFVMKYAWAVPNDEAIDLCVKFSPLVEIGSGLGYWAKLISEAGGDIIAYDNKPGKTYDNKDAEVWYPIQRGGPSKAKKHPDRTLMLCWPPYDKPMANNALRMYHGQHVIYIGESSYGCTGDEAFHARLDRDFEEIQKVWLPQWEGIHDNMYVYRRK